MDKMTPATMSQAVLSEISGVGNVFGRFREKGSLSEKTSKKKRTPGEKPGQEKGETFYIEGILYHIANVILGTRCQFLLHVYGGLCFCLSSRVTTDFVF